jgi:hypothetical protein
MPAQAPLIALVTGAVLTLNVLSVLGEDRVSAEYGVAAGRDIRDSTITIGLTPEQVREAMRAIYQQESAAQAKIDQLSQRLDATHEAVVGFLRILDRNEVPLEKLPGTLAQIAQRHREMLERLAALNPEDPAAQALIEQARALLRSANTEADYDRADQLLGQAEATELAAVRMAEDFARQAQEAANRRRLNAAAARAERGELELTRLNYLEAAQHFKAASATVPASDAQARGEYLNRYADALYRHGDEKGDNAALLQAIAVYREALKELTRERVPLQWALPS